MRNQAVVQPSARVCWRTAQVFSSVAQSALQLAATVPAGDATAGGAGASQHKPQADAVTNAVVQAASAGRKRSKKGVNRIESSGGKHGKNNKGSGAASAAAEGAGGGRADTAATEHRQPASGTRHHHRTPPSQQHPQHSSQTHKTELAPACTFRSSQLKKEPHIRFAPTNLHVQLLSISAAVSADDAFPLTAAALALPPPPQQLPDAAVTGPTTVFATGTAAAACEDASEASAAIPATCATTGPVPSTALALSSPAVPAVRGTAWAAPA